MRAQRTQRTTSESVRVSLQWYLCENRNKCVYIYTYTNREVGREVSQSVGW